MKLKNITFGADPEFFLINKDGEHIPAIGKIGGTKEEPLDIGKGVKLQEDNVMVEFNVNPTTSADNMWEDIQYAIKTAEEMSELKADIIDAARFDDKHLKSPQACHVGCSPDFNVWEEKKNKTIDIKKSNFRFAGGHLHIGFDVNKDDYYVACYRLVKLLDFLLLPEFYDVNTNHEERIKYYGRPGNFRVTTYGLEYRSLGNAWIKSQKSVEKVLHIAKVATENLEDERLLREAADYIKPAVTANNPHRYMQEARRNWARHGAIDK